MISDRVMSGFLASVRWCVRFREPSQVDGRLIFNWLKLSWLLPIATLGVIIASSRSYDTSWQAIGAIAIGPMVVSVLSGIRGWIQWSRHKMPWGHHAFAACFVNAIIWLYTGVMVFGFWALENLG